ncbi:hypothetical protein [Candidatus Phytoplasma solani]|uniref:Uncharacterized protein n=3 Tax=Candidatus Phytoplasma solani TaxID=69896 RepID=A0A421NUQ4_9MOLU|nr:hypothetical protein [Candidatus Phytoplasma solani]RMI87722.1 hypothetical protein PSSA1_v1c6270 [Candidatus Phytoplasma solani]
MNKRNKLNKINKKSVLIVIVSLMILTPILVLAINWFLSHQDTIQHGKVSIGLILKESQIDTKKLVNSSIPNQFLKDDDTREFQVKHKLKLVQKLTSNDLSKLRVKSERKFEVKKDDTLDDNLAKLFHSRLVVDQKIVTDSWDQASLLSFPSFSGTQEQEPELSIMILVCENDLPDVILPENATITMTSTYTITDPNGNPLPKQDPITINTPMPPLRI